MGVTTRLRFAGLCSLLAFYCAGAVLADEVKTLSRGYTLNGDLVLADGQQMGGRVLLMVHGTLGHKNMELIETLQSVFQESGQSSLAINLSLNIGDRTGFYPCDVLHTHQFDDAVKEIDVWVDWLNQQGAEQIVLLGHSRGANQVLKYLLGHERSAKMAILLAPSVRKAVADDGVLQIIDSGSMDDVLEGIDFLHCKDADVIASSYLSYYGPDAHNDSIPLLQQIAVPTLVFSGSEDQVVAELGSRIDRVDNPLVTHIEIFGADHFFRDLNADDVVDDAMEFMERQEEPWLVAFVALFVGTPNLEF